LKKAEGGKTTFFKKEGHKSRKRRKGSNYCQKKRVIKLSERSIMKRGKTNWGRGLKLKKAQESHKGKTTRVFVRQKKIGASKKSVKKGKATQGKASPVSEKEKTYAEKVIMGTAFWGNGERSQVFQEEGA